MSQWDERSTVVENIQLPHTLLSRFDLIFLMLDPQDEQFDRRLATHLVSLYHQSKEDKESVYMVSGGSLMSVSVITPLSSPFPLSSPSLLPSSPHPFISSSPPPPLPPPPSSLLQDMSSLRDYIAYARSYVQPSLSEEAGQALVQAYVGEPIPKQLSQS